MFRLKRLKLLILLGAAFSSLLLLSCDTTERIGPGDTDSRADSFVEEPAVDNSSVNAEATKEYMESIPKWERTAIQTREANQYYANLRLDAEQQAKNWIEYSRPKCNDFFGTKLCNLWIVTLEEYSVCGFRPHKVIELADLQPKGHYYLIFGDEAGKLSGGYQWIASYGYAAHKDGVVLKITDCWKRELFPHYERHPEEIPNPFPDPPRN